MHFFSLVLCFACWILNGKVAMAVTRMPIPVRDKSNGVCKTDKDCIKFPGSVCVDIAQGDFIQGKCTPNVDAKPVCRGGQSGLCPQYQSPTVGYLNPQCVLVKKDSVRMLQTTTDLNISTTEANSTIVVSDTHLKTLKCPTDTSLLLSDVNCWFNTNYKEQLLTVQYKCVDYNMCMEQSAVAEDPTHDSKDAYCRPKRCVSGDRQLCNNQGTCQGNDPINAMRHEGYSCRCYSGFAGDKCEKTMDDSCDVDCGLGGACIKNKCVCYEGYLGKDKRCLKCTSDAACEHKNKCNLDTGKCECAPGYIGDTCGGKTDPCVGVSCSHGGTCMFEGQKSYCVCSQCSGNKCKECGGIDPFTLTADCSMSAGCPANLTSAEDTNKASTTNSDGTSKGSRSVAVKRCASIVVVPVMIILFKLA